jgi:imidazolonepropionase
VTALDARICLDIITPIRGPASMMRIDNVTLWTGEVGCAATPGQSVVLDGGRIAWTGPTQAAPGAPGLDAAGRLMTPGLIDCHTHLVHAGHRGDEFAARLRGQTYAQISAAGGGIMSTVRATRAATDGDLLDHSMPRLNALRREGVTTVEIKSGYGLDLETELRMLRVARDLAAPDMTVRTSFLGAHAVPPEYRGRADDYLDQVCLPALQAAHRAGLVDAVDAFCEGIAFSPAQVDRLFRAARDLGLPVKLHAEQLSHLGGATRAAAQGALSADHLEYATDADARAMAAAGTVAVLLPGAFYALRERQAPPVAAFRAHGVPMAVATDLNPGSSPLSSPLLAMNMACSLFGLTVDEALSGMTRIAGRALGLTDRGVIAPGARADLCLWDAGSPAELVYRMGFPALSARYVGGVQC